MASKQAVAQLLQATQGVVGVAPQLASISRNDAIQAILREIVRANAASSAVFVEEADRLIPMSRLRAMAVVATWPSPTTIQGRVPWTSDYDPWQIVQGPAVQFADSEMNAPGALLFLPLREPGKPWQALVLHDSDEHRRWDKQEIVAAQALAAVVTAALSRAHAKAAPRDPDVSEQDFLQEIKAFQGSLAARTERFDQLSEHAPVGIFQTDTAGNPVWVNDRWHELIGQSAASFLPHWQEAATGDGDFHQERRIVIAPGRGAWVQETVVPVRDDRGVITGYLGTLTDITERKQAEIQRENLAHSELLARRDLATQSQRLAELIAPMTTGVLVECEERTVVLANQAFCDLFGITARPDELVGTNCAEAARQASHLMADPPGFVARIEELIGKRQPATDEVALADGRIIERDYVPVRVIDTNEGHLWIYRDITDRKTMDAQRERLLQAELYARRTAEAAQHGLAEQNERLRQLDDLRGYLLAVASHELRTPLTSIISFAHLLSDTEHLTDEQSYFVSIIGRNADRLLRLVDDLLLLARLGSGAVPLHFEPVQLDKLIAEAVLEAQPTAEDKDIRLQAFAVTDATAQGDPVRLLQVFGNLISNGTKFTQAGGEVTVRLTRDNEAWRIDVSDNGVGIPEDEIPQLFGEFFRASTARDAGEPGTGLGLAIVKIITELHDGSVTVQSELGRGSTFTITLPVSS